MKKTSGIKIFLAVFLFFISAQAIFAQGAACSSAASLTVNGACDNGTFSSSSGTDPAISTCSITLNGDGWYKFTAIATSTTVDFTNSGSKNGAIFIYTGACGSLAYNSCINANGNSGDETLTLTTTVSTVYYVRIVRDGTGTGNLTGTVCITSPTIPGCATQTTPANAATAQCNSGTTLNWTAPTTGGTPTGYKLYFGTDALATNIVNGTNIGNVLTYNPGALLPNTTYYWKIVATNAVGDALSCSVHSFTTTTTGCYIQQTVTASACGGTYYDSGGSGGTYNNNESSVITFVPSTAGQKVQVTFSAFNTESGYDFLYIYNGSSTGATLVATLSGTTIPTCAYTSSDATGDLTFKFTSDISNTFAGWTAALACVASAPAPDCSAITSPTNGTTGLCNSGITLNWAAPTTGCGFATGYLLYLGTDAAATNIVNGTNVGNVLTYTAGTLSPSTMYYWKIVPTNGVASASGCTINTFATNSGCYDQQAGSFSNCGANYYDSNGPSANYANNENSTITFCPSIAGQYVQINFSSFATEANNDVLTVYDGNSTSAPVIAALSGTNLPCPITATNSTGCLTFKFVSDNSTKAAGWEATISCVATPPAVLAGTTCANAPSITLPFSSPSQTTACYLNDYTNASTGSCGTLYESGEDHVYAYTATASECIGITLTNASTSSIGYQVYSGCPGSAGAACVGNGGGATSGTLTGTVTLPSAGTYYLIVDTYSTPFNATYDLAVTSFGSGPVNDLPCNATLMTLGTSQSGDNSCSSGTGEPAAPSCWTTGNNNSVWYKVVPTGTTMKVKTTVGTLINTQIAVYSGTCGASLTMVASSCNDNAPACGGTTDYSSYVSLTGLTAGTTYYIRVDGSASLTGTFGVVAIDGASTFPPLAGQDCGLGNPVCNASMSVSNPGYQGIGSSCDLPTSYCLSSGERGSAWYTWTTNAAGFINFDIVPNDWPGAPSTTSTDYDFALWKVSPTVTCSTILAGSSTPVACNYSSLGVTGISPTGNAPTAYPGYDGSYEPEIACASGDTWLLVINNYTTSTQGFSINFSTGSGAAPINYTPSPTSINWSGGANTAWNVANNWGGCAVPVCGIDAVVNAFAVQPSVTSAMGAQYVKNLTINLGATLTLQAGSILHICGNLVNNGNIVASPTSTIIFDNAATSQTITGNFTGSNKLGNLTITKTGGSVLANSDIDVGGVFTTSNTTSIFDSNGKSIKVAGNFMNADGNNTFANTGTTGTLTFNGTAAQTYTQGASQLDLNNVVLSHTGTGVTLSTNMYIKAATGTLTLTSGKIITGSDEVNVANTASAAVSSGNSSSFVQGNLRRYVAATGAYDFPVGHATKGYQLANINFTAATSIGNLLARFDPWGITPVTQNGSECTTTYNLPSEDNGWWTITANANAGTGTYTTTLHPNGATNTSPASGWTVIKTPTTETGAWALVGTCNPSSTATTVVRSGMSGFSLFSAAQATTPLPIELLSFTGKSEGTKNKLMWVTASETNNDFFTLERSETGASFEAFATKDGAGNSSVVIDYDAYDPSPYNGITYYRLKQTDYNGKFTYSSIIAIENKLDQIAVSNVHPNPTTDDLNFDFYSPVKGNVQIQVLDYTGRIVLNKTVEVEEGKISLETQMSELAKGVYSLKVEFSEGNFRSVTKVIKY